MCWRWWKIPYDCDYKTIPSYLTDHPSEESDVFDSEDENSYYSEEESNEESESGEEDDDEESESGEEDENDSDYEE